MKRFVISLFPGVMMQGQKHWMKTFYGLCCCEREGKPI